MQVNVQEPAIPPTLPGHLLPGWVAHTEGIARQWLDALLKTSEQVDESGETLRFLHRRVEQLVAQLVAEQPDDGAARAVGALIAERFEQPAILAASHQLLDARLLDGLPETTRWQLRPRLSQLLSQVMVGFMEEREATLRYSHRMFLSHLRHELGSPLTAITGFTYLMLRGKDPLSETQREDVQAIQSAGQHLIELLNDVSDVYKMDMGRLRIQPRTFEVAGLVEEVTETARPLLHKCGNTLSVEIDSGAGQMCHDRKKIERLLNTLLAHAIWATREGNVSLRVERGEGELWVRVRHSGHGLSHALRAIIFHPSTETAFQLAMERGDTALALLLCRRLAEFLGGELVVERNNGQGGGYALCLPLEVRR